MDSNTERECRSTADVLSFLYQLSLDQSDFRFRGQANYDWTLQPSIFRYSKLKRYQTAIYEGQVLARKPRAPHPPLTYTDLELEWLILCQHYGVPTRLLDWTQDVLIALYFACSDEAQASSDGCVFVCNTREYQKFSAYTERVNESQDLAFLATTLLNPRMRSQAGCFMIWGYKAHDGKSKDSYDLWQYRESAGHSDDLKKIRIPSGSKKEIIRELSDIYQISQNSLFHDGGYLERKFGPGFSRLKERALLETLYLTDADILSPSEEALARSAFNIDCRNMLAGAVSFTKSIHGG